MSWLGGSFSSLTGQLSNLTKDILTEGTEEVSDHVTELRLAQERIKELDTVNVSQKIEIDRLKLAIRESEEKAESSELQINNISREYRALLEQKEGEIKKLKVENQELKSSTVQFTQQSEPAVLRLDSDNGFSSVGFGSSDEHDFGDNIAMQHDINRLRGNLRQLEAECKHWKSLVQQQQGTTDEVFDGGKTEQVSHDDSALLKQIQSLQAELSHEKDQRQHEVLALQDAHTHKLSQMRRKHREEVAALNTRIQELDWGSEGWDTQPSADETSLKQTISSMKEEITSLQSEREDHMAQITSLTRALEEHKSNLAIKEAQTLHLENQLKVCQEQVRELGASREEVGQELFELKHRLLDQLDANHADTLEVLSDLREVRQHMDLSAISRRNKLLLEKDKIACELTETGVKKASMATDVAQLEEENQSISADATSMVHSLGDAQQQALTAGIVDSLEQENLELKERNVGLQEQVTLLERALQTANTEGASRRITADSNTVLEQSDLSGNNADLVDEINTLRDHARAYEEEIARFEVLQSDWLSEKEALEGVLLELRQQLKSREESLNAAEAQKGLLTVEKVVSSSTKTLLPDIVDYSIKDEPCNDKSGRYEKSRDDSSKVDLSKDDSSNGDAIKDDASIVGSSKDDASIVGSSKDDASTVGLSKDDTSMVGSSKDDASMVGSSKDDTSMVGSSSVGSSSNSFEDLAEDVVELDRKVGLLTEANAVLEQERDELAESNERLVMFNSALERERDTLTQENEELQEQLFEHIEEKAKLRQEVINLTERRPRTTSRTTSISETGSVESQDDKPSELTQLLKDKETELQAIMGEKEDLEIKSLSEVSELKLQLQQKEEELESLQKSQDATVSNNDGLEILEKEIEEFKKKLRGKNEEIVNLSLEKEEMMQSLEELDNQHQEAMGHLIKMKEKLTKSNEDLKKQVKTLEDEKQAISAELETVKRQHLMNQADESLSSNELNQQIAELKDEMDTLIGAIEGKETEKMKLDAENKSLKETVNEMKGKLSDTAATLNDLHMDKQELHDKISKLKEDMSKQAEKLKVMREENDQLRRDLTDGKVEESVQQSASAKDLEIMEKENEDLKSQLENLNKDAKHRLAENEKVQSELTEVKGTVDSLNSSLTSKDGEIANLKEKITESEEELRRIKKDCEKLKKEATRKHEDCESFSRQLHALESELTPLKEEFSQKEKENDELMNQVEMLNNELTLFKGNLNDKNEECKKLTEELKDVKGLLEDTTDKLHTKCEESNELMDEVEGYRQQIETMKNDQQSEYDAQLLSATGELVLVKEELSRKTEEFERLDKELYAKDEEIERLNNHIEQFSKENEHFKQQVENLEQTLIERDKKLEDLNNEIERLKVEEKNLEVKQSQQVKHYESYIEELKATKDSSNSSLQSQYDELLDKSHKKDLQISEMEAKITNLFSQMQECQKELESSSDQLAQYQLICDNSKKDISSLEDRITALSTENESLKQSLKQSEMSASELNETQEKLEMVQSERDYLDKALKESTDHHASELTSHAKEKEEWSAKIQKLELALANEIKQESADHNEMEGLLKEKEGLIERIILMETDVMQLNGLIQEKENALKELSDVKDKVERSLEESKQTINIKDTELEDLQKTIGNLEMQIKELESVKKKEKSDAEKVEKEIVNESIQSVQKVQLLGTAAPNGSFDGEELEHSQDVLKEIERLKGQLDQKDNVISELQRNNASLLKMLDVKSKNSGDTSHMDLIKLENEMKSIKLEREQMMDVLNDKSRESSNLKAEVQRLMSVLSAQKTALDKLQSDNIELSKKSDVQGDHIDDMQKQVVQNLSRIIRDKDLEIESLSQKNETLLSVLQESSTEGNQINSLMKEKDELIKQTATLQSEREQMIAYLNQKHQESLTYHAECQRLQGVVNEEKEQCEKAKQEFEVLKPLYEENKQSLVKAQNELLNYKQKYQELEMKCGQLIQRSDSMDHVDKAEYDAKVQESNKLQERYNELMMSVKEKELKIQSLHQQISELEQNIRTIEHERSGYKKQVDNFTFQLHGIQTEHGDLKTEVGQLKLQRDGITAECQALRESNKKLTLQVQDKEFEVSSLQEKNNSLTMILQQQSVTGTSSGGPVQTGAGGPGVQAPAQVVQQDTEATQAQLRQLTRERDQAVLGMQQIQEQYARIQAEVQESKEKEAKMHRDMNRLREHLLQIEDGYTKEALAAEEREKELRTRLATAEENAFTSSSAVQTANQQAVQQLDSLQQQLAFVSQQRDQAYQQISSLQEQNTMYSGSITNLQMVLEEFQQEKDRLVAEESERLTKEVTSLRSQVSKLQADLKYTKEQLDEASDGLEAASRLSEQLDKKEEAIDALREEVLIRETTLKAVEDELRHIKSRNDDRVDKLVIKNLFLGYFSTPQNKRHEVLRTIGGVLLFTADDFEKIEGTHKGGWLPGFLHFGGGTGQKPMSPPGTPVRRSTIGGHVTRNLDNSFSQMFVNFLERESSPPPPAVRLPAEEMARDVQQKSKDAHNKPLQNPTHKPVFNPFTAPRHVAMPAHSTPLSGAHNSHILISPGSPSTDSFPTFAPPTESSRTPPGSGRSTPASSSTSMTSSAILKDVLNR